MAKETIAAQFQQADQERSPLLHRCRDYAALTVADVLPPLNQDQYTELPACWDNIGGVGVENLVGRLLTSLFPVGLPWFRIVPSAELKANDQLTAEQKNQFIALLYLRELVAATKLEASNYRLAERSALESLIVTGNSLTRQGDDYSVRYYRFDNWVCRRSGTGTLLWTITREKKHTSELTSDIRAKARIKDSEDKEYDLYTRCKRVQVGDSEYRWHIQQEINDRIVTDNAEAMEPVNPYCCVAYRLCPGENYSRGFIATRFPDIKSVNALQQAIQFAAANAAKMVPVVDPSEPGIRPQDLLKNNGQPISGRVVNGVVQGVAFLQTNKSGDLSTAAAQYTAKMQSLGRDMLLEAASMPKGERVTAFAVSRIAQELQGALGGPYAHIADELQKPLIERTLYLLQRDKILAPITGEARRAVKVDVLTGSAALSKEISLNTMLDALQIISTVPGGLDRINMDILVDRILAFKGVDTTGLIKTHEQIAQELQDQAQRQLMSEAGSQAVKTLGELVTQRGAAEQAQ